MTKKNKKLIEELTERRKLRRLDTNTDKKPTKSIFSFQKKIEKKEENNSLPYSHNSMQKFGNYILPFKQLYISLTIFGFIVAITAFLLPFSMTQKTNNNTNQTAQTSISKIESKFLQQIQSLIISIENTQKLFENKLQTNKKILLDESKTLLKEYSYLDSIYLIKSIDNKENIKFDDMLYTNVIPNIKIGDKIYYFPVNQMITLSENRVLQENTANNTITPATFYEAFTEKQKAISPFFVEQTNEQFSEFDKNNVTSIKLEIRNIWITTPLLNNSGQAVYAIAYKININKLLEEISNEDKVQFILFNQHAHALADANILARNKYIHREESFLGNLLGETTKVHKNELNIFGAVFLYEILFFSEGDGFYPIKMFFGYGVGLLLLVVGGSIIYKIVQDMIQLDTYRLKILNYIDTQNQDLQSNERRFKYLVESTNVVPWTADIEKKCFTYVGPQIEALSGHSIQTWYSQGFWMHHIFQEDRNKIFNNMAELSTGKPIMREYRMQKPDGSIVWIRNSFANANPEKNIPGKIPNHIQGFMVDITDQKNIQIHLEKARKEAEHANVTKSEFLATMSHELRTPLNSIIGFSEIMESQALGPLGNDSYLQYVNNIYTSGKHLLDLINDILDLSKIEAGHFELQLEDVDLSDIFRSCNNLLSERAKKADINLDIATPPITPVLHVDARRLKQVFINVLTNAIKFTPKHGNVTMNALIMADFSVKIIIRDSGIGMRHEDIPKALSKFSQVDSKLNRSQEGTGLGLPISKSLIELHGGIFLLESVYGEGTTISVTLPPESVRNMDKLKQHYFTKEPFQSQNTKKTA